MAKPTVAILLARGDSRGFPLLKDLEYKALLPIRGRPMIQYVLEALHDSDVEKVFIIQGEDEGLQRFLAGSAKSVLVSCPGNSSSLVESVACALETLVVHYGEDGLAGRNVMVVPCDIPMARARDFNCLLRLSQNQAADVCFAIIRNQLLRNAFPKRRYRSLYLKDLGDTYTMQTVAFADGRIFGLRPAPGGGRLKPVIFDRTGAPVQGLVNLVNGLRDLRHGMFFCPYLVYGLLLRRLAAGGHGTQAVRLVRDLLRRELTVAEIRRIFDLALGLRLGVFESDAVAFSGDIDCPEDLDHLLRTGFPPVDEGS